MKAFMEKPYAKTVQRNDKIWETYAGQPTLISLQLSFFGMKYTQTEIKKSQRFYPCFDKLITWSYLFEY